MNIQTEFSDLVGYAPIGPIQRRGSMSVGIVKAFEGDDTYWVEEIDEESAPADLFARARSQWQQNLHRQPAGSLRQRDFFDNGQRLTRVIDFPSGQPVSTDLFQRKFDVPTALQIARSLTECLADWHKTSRIHAGLNGECLYWHSVSGIEVREVEFFQGQFRQEFSALSTDAVVFYSPESSGSLAREVSPASDLYSVGVLLFSMIAGRPPIEAEDASDYLGRQLCEEAPRLRELGLDIPPVLDDIVARLLKRDPRDRYESASGLLFDLECVADDLNHLGDDISFAIGTRDIRQTLTEANLVGRNDEIDFAWQAIRVTPRANASVQMVIGPETNSRQCFLDEIALRATVQGMYVFRGGASTGNPKPLQSLETVLAAIATCCMDNIGLARRISKATAEHGGMLADLLPELAGLWPNSDGQTGPDLYGDRRAAFALEELFAAFASEPEGVVLLFDDLDLADDLTQTVVRALVDRMKRQQEQLALHVIASGESAQRVEFFSKDSRIHLGPLANESLVSYLQSIAGRLGNTITDAIVEVADGDANMASTILRRMIDTGVVKTSPDGWQPDGPLSESLRGDECIAESLERQISALPPDALRILSAAAVVGQHFDLAILSHLTGTSYAKVLEVSSDAVRRRLLWRDPQAGGFRFAHNLIHEKLRSSLDDQQRRRLHLEIGTYLEEHDPANIFELAVHYDAAGDRDRALSNSLEAARAARLQYSLSIARDQLRIAQRWLRKEDHRTGLQIWEGLGEIELLSGQYDEAAVSLQEALRLAEPGQEIARVQQKIGEVAFKRGRFSEAASEYETALAMTGVRVPGNFVSMLSNLLYQSFCQVIHTCLPSSWIARKTTPSELDSLRLQLLSRLSHVYWFSRHKLWTLGNHLRSLNTAERFAPSDTLAAVYSEHGPVMSLLRWFSRANQYAERSLEIRKQMGDVWGQGQSHHYLSVVKLAECRFQEAIASASEAVELLRKMGDVWEMNMARYQAANAHYRIGNYCDATELATEMYQEGCAIGDLQATGISLDVWARTSPQTLPLKIVAAEAEKSRPDAQSHAQTQLAYAIILLHHERIDEAIEVLNNAISRSKRAGHLNTYISPCYAWLGTALRRRVEQTNRRDGRHLLARIVETRRALIRASRISRGFRADRAHCLRELGLLHTISGNTRSAARYFRRSLCSAKKCNQRREEFETLECLLHLHDLEAELLGEKSANWKTRFDELNPMNSDASHLDHAVSTKPSNLSLADRFVTVLQSGRQIAQALSADVVYREASEAARKLLRGQYVDVVTISEQEGHLSFAPLPDRADDEASHARIHRHDAIIRSAHAEGKAVCETSVRSSWTKVGSVIAAPIAFRGTNVAVVLVTHDELKDLFSVDEQRIADFVSTLAGAALENADGFLRLRQLNDTLEQRVMDRTKAAEERAQQLALSNEQLRATEDQLREAIVHANAANEAKGRFLATISHEIRTPLNGILGMTRLAQGTSDSQRQAGYLDTVQESGESLLTLINDLLDVSKLESGKLELEQIELKPSLIAAEICRLMTASAVQKSVELVCEISPDVPEAILGDPSRIRQIMMNLIGNAIKFTERGAIVLKMSFDRGNRSQTSLCFSVKDSGIGIPADKICSVFESFSQVDSSTTRRYGGTGLGLAICRELTERMGGSIKLESELGVGSLFKVTIPADVVDLPLEHTWEDEAPAEPVRREPHAPGKLTSTARQTSDLNEGVTETERLSRQPIRILVAEDGAINQEVIVGLLEMKGYDVVVANDGEEALQKASEDSFALCLMDVDMPKMDGIEATKMIRSSVPGGDQESLPIVAMTAYCGDQIWAKCEAAGMNAYIPKPIDPDKLFEKIERFTQSC